MFTKFINNFLTYEECDKIIELGESVGLFKMKSTTTLNGNIIETNVDYHGNKRMGCYFYGDMLLIPELKSITNKVINLSNDLKPYKSIVYTKIPKYSFNRYSKDDYLEWHEDNDEILHGATITFIIQLNVDYENGYIKYRYDDVEYVVEKEKGSVFIFDSNITHMVDKINGGVRYSLNVWPASDKKMTLI